MGSSSADQQVSGSSYASNIPIFAQKGAADTCCATDMRDLIGLQQWLPGQPCMVACSAATNKQCQGCFAMHPEMLSSGADLTNHEVRPKGELS